MNIAGDSHVILVGMASALTNSKSSSLTVKTIKHKLGKYLKRVIPQGEMMYEDAQEMAVKCLELFPDDLTDKEEVKKRVRMFIQQFPNVTNVLPMII